MKYKKFEVILILFGICCVLSGILITNSYDKKKEVGTLAGSTKENNEEPTIGSIAESTTKETESNGETVIEKSTEITNIPLETYSNISDTKPSIDMTIEEISSTIIEWGYTVGIKEEDILFIEAIDDGDTYRLSFSGPDGKPYTVVLNHEKELIKFIK